MSPNLPADYHLHDNFSPDSKAVFADHVLQARKLNLPEICLTNHAEFDRYLDGAWTIDVKACYESYSRVKAANPDVSMRFGLEIGMPDDYSLIPELKKRVEGVPLDFVLLSVHELDNSYVFYPEFFEGKTYAEAAERYLTVLYERIRLFEPSFFSSVGHLDCVTKAMLPPEMFADRRVYYSYFADVFDEFARYLIHHGKCFEVNTSTYKRLGDLPIPGFDWLKRYVELGGEYITFGSDAHDPRFLGNRFADAAELARSAGIRYYARYDQMKPSMHPL